MYGPDIASLKVISLYKYLEFQSPGKTKRPNLPTIPHLQLQLSQILVRWRAIENQVLSGWGCQRCLNPLRPPSMPLLVQSIGPYGSSLWTCSWSQVYIGNFSTLYCY